MREKLKLLDIFSDESSGSRFRALCSVSLLDADLEKIQVDFQKILSKYDFKEVKFNELRTHKPKLDCAREFIEIAIDFASKNKLRIDVLIWDIQDSRHNIVGRDDKENLERMYYHLLRTVIEAWKIFKIDWYPDEHLEYDYKKIADFIDLTKFPRTKPLIIKMFEEQKINLEVASLQPQKSEDQPLIQLADLFAGLARFSRENSDNYIKWTKYLENKKMPSLFNLESEEEEQKQTLINRFELIELIATKCKEKRISVSINTNKYLKTYDKKIPINFWHYEPKGEYDKAPTKKKRD